MKLEVMSELRCTVCCGAIDGESWYNKNGVIVVFVPPCPVCNHAKQQNTTPRAGEKIEVRLEDFPPGNYNTRTATGEYSSDGEVETNNLVNPSSRSRWPQWRYPGEEKWRKAGW